VSCRLILSPASAPRGGRFVRGFSLIEVMVTIVIVSFGLLGLAGLLFSSINAGQTSMTRSVAVNLANEMADRLRANWEGIRQGGFETAANADCFAKVATGCETTCMTGSCGAGDQAKLDVCLWKAQVEKQLPGGTACVQLSPGNDRCADATKVCSYIISLRWNESAYRSDASTLFQSTPTTYSIRVQP